ncbi:MAG: response regulator [Rhodobacterales bacterium]|jgi:DNA-binding response OmpR family regulator|nr:response regulator [Rhodobacterales bacterium]
MQVLIVESTAALAELWQRHLERHGLTVSISSSGEAACDLIGSIRYDVIILDLVLAEGAAFAVADYAQYRWPQTSVIFVTDTTFFSDGSIFSIVPNARAFIQTRTPPEDLAAMVEHYGRAA